MSLELPTSAGVSFAHAAVQVIAVGRVIDVLHIKGPAVRNLILAEDTLDDAASGHFTEKLVARRSIDADVLVRPSQVERFLEAVGQHGWRLSVPFADGSTFEHAATLVHPSLAPVDVHRRFPGVGLDPEEAFDRLWRDHSTQAIAGIDSWTPSVAAQRLILLLNAARGGSNHDDRDVAWNRATAGEQEEVREIARELRADVALAAATGHLEEYADRREHDLWELLSAGAGTPFQRWRARIRAETNPVKAVRTGWRLLVPTSHRMSLEAGRDLVGLDLLRAYVQRLTLGFGQTAGLVGRRVGGRITQRRLRPRTRG